MSLKKIAVGCRSLTDLHQDLLQFVILLFHVINVVAVFGSLDFVYLILNFISEFGRDVVFMLVQLLFCAPNSSVNVVQNFGSVTFLLVFIGKSLSLILHPADVLLGKTSAGLDLDLLFFSSSLVLGRDLDNTVSINIEGNFDLRLSSGRRWDSDKIEGSEKLVVSSHFSLTLVDFDANLALVVNGGGENFGLLGWNGGVSVD